MFRFPFAQITLSRVWPSASVTVMCSADDSAELSSSKTMLFSAGVDDCLSMYQIRRSRRGIRRHQKGVATHIPDVVIIHGFLPRARRILRHQVAVLMVRATPMADQISGLICNQSGLIPGGCRRHIGAHCEAGQYQQRDYLLGRLFYFHHGFSCK